MDGCCAHPRSENMSIKQYETKVPRNSFTTVGEVTQGLKEAGLEASYLIFGIDFTASNMTQGSQSSFSLNLHALDPSGKRFNPYQQVINILGRTLAPFDDYGFIPAYGFGDATTRDQRVFPFNGGLCRGFEEVLTIYNRVSRDMQMSGPTNFAPLIYEAINIVKATRRYHILVIVAGSQVTNEQQTRQAIYDASKYPLSIVMVGVGDGPWDMMEEFNSSLPKRRFDNFQFVNMYKVVSNSAYPQASFAHEALMELPNQFISICKLGLLKVVNEYFICCQ